MSLDYVARGRKMGELRAIVERHYANVNAGTLDRERDVFDGGVVTVDPGAGQMNGLDAFIGYLGAFRTAMPDARIEGKTFVEQDDTVTVEGIYSGTHTGPLASPQGAVPPTGRRLALPYLELFRIRSGKITEHRVYYDQMAFLGQLGLLLSPAAA
jgi:predicted ester cyclase